jgi:myo-inositol-1(or 4)-monophosphatase
MTDILRVAMDAARETGELLLERRGRIRSVEAKDDRSLVTDVDREAEALIRARISAAFPSHGILGEEDGGSGSGADTVWVIDPLDGTHNYIRGIPLFGVSIGVIRGGEFVAGVIDIPAEGRRYAAERGGGAFVNGRRIAVSQGAVPAAWSVGLDSELRTGFAGKARVLEALGRAVFNLRMLGSSARSLALVAEGGLDGLVEFFDQPWDFAAGVAIVEEAGGRVTTFDGRTLPCAASAYVAGGPAAHRWLLDLVRGTPGGTSEDRTSGGA